MNTCSSQPKQVVLAVTGASGACYAQRFLERAAALDDVALHVVLTDTARDIWRHELGCEPPEGFDNHRFDTPFCSGSSAADVMVVLPCSMGMLARIAAGTVECDVAAGRATFAADLSNAGDSPSNDSTWHHLVGANATIRHKHLEIQLTAIENIWSDSIHPYRNAKYNQHYFRGRNQAVLGSSVRYNHGWFDVFGEFAATQNKTWGFGTIVGSRFYPASGISLVALYRYYSPWFDNALGYAFSETSRLGDENGGYLGIELTRWRGWRITGYGDVFYFSGPKYGIPDSPSLGYDAMTEIRYGHHSPVTNEQSPITYARCLRQAFCKG